MICKNCGTEMPDNAKFCPKCGSAAQDDEINISAAGAERAVPRGFSARKNIIIIIIAAVLLIGGGITAIAVVNSHSATSGISDKLQLAERYLNEQNYEQAVIEYQKVLEIEPMNVDAYLGLADAYIGKGDPNKAISALRDGLEQTKDDKIKTRLIKELLNRAQERINSGDYDNSISDLQSILDLDAKNVDAYLGLADAYLAQGQTDKALEILRKGLEKTGDNRIQSRIEAIVAQDAPVEPTVSEPTTSEPTVSEPAEPVYGSMGFVTILGEEYDIATTTHLGISDVDMTDGQWRDISKLTNLTSLQIVSSHISDITPLANLINLTELDLWDNHIEDITSLVNLTNLTKLSLERNQISDIKPLANLVNLTELELNDNKFRDITPLTNLTNLNILTLGAFYSGSTNSDIDDITPLCNLTQLMELDLMNNQISDITPLANLTNLTGLTLSGNLISDITPLANLTKLKYLSLGGNQISDITPLAKLTNLTKLDLWRNQISNITPLAKLTNLTELYLSYNQISDITLLANFKQLDDLWLSRNQISDITPLANLTNLTRLYIDYNQIKNIEPLFNLPQLMEICFEYNEINSEDYSRFIQRFPNCRIK